MSELEKIKEEFDRKAEGIFEEMSQAKERHMRGSVDLIRRILPDVTQDPWTAFSDGGKLRAVMPAGRPGDVYAFSESPRKADGEYLLYCQPQVIAWLIAKLDSFDAQSAALGEPLPRVSTLQEAYEKKVLDDGFCCSFCGKSSKETRVVQGPAVYICEECIELCRESLAEEVESE
jgi:hypothetical protein